MLTKIRKRDGRYVKFNEEKINQAIQKAVTAVDAEVTLNKINKITDKVVKQVEETTPEGRIPTVEYVQDVVEEVLMLSKLPEVAKAYILYREERSKIRERESRLMKKYDDFEKNKMTSSTIFMTKTPFSYENPVKSILQYGREGAKEYNKMFVIDPNFTELHEKGDIFIKGMEFYTSSLNTLNLRLDKVFSYGPERKYGRSVVPKQLYDHMLTILLFVSRLENELSGSINIPAFDYYMVEPVKKAYEDLFFDNLEKLNRLLNLKINVNKLKKQMQKDNLRFSYLNHDQDYLLEDKLDKKTLKVLYEETETDLKKLLHKSFFDFLITLNLSPTINDYDVFNMSINYGTETSNEGRLVIETLLNVTKGGDQEGRIFSTPVQIFKVKEGKNFFPKDKNYDLFIKAIETSSQMMYPNFSFLDASFNKRKDALPREEVSYTATRNRISGNVISYNDEDLSRGSISETVINLPRLALLSKDVDDFYEKLDLMLETVVNQQLERYKDLSTLRKFHLPVLMTDGIWVDSNSLNKNDLIGPILKNGTLDIGFIGLSEALYQLVGSHHGQSEEAQKLGLAIVGKMKDKIYEAKEKYELNFQLVASSKVGLLSSFVTKDQEEFGILRGVTDKTFYTDSFHVPSDYFINAEDKIKIEGPYHKLIEGGHITYLEFGPEATANPKVMLRLLKKMKKEDMGYVAINHEIDVVVEKAVSTEGILDEIHETTLNYRRINDLLIAPINLTNLPTEEVDLRVKHLNNTIRISGFTNDSIVDGPGLRFVVFTQGCLIGCYKCHNENTWPLDGGRLVEVDDVVKMWRKNPLIEGVTFSGGDPLLQPDKILYLIRKAKETGLNTCVYSGVYYEDLLKSEDNNIIQILEEADILIDGPFEYDKLNLNLPYRGSENQRVIDLVKTREKNEVTLLVE